jgi:hypothetical protein
MLKHRKASYLENRRAWLDVSRAANRFGEVVLMI